MSLEKYLFTFEKLYQTLQQYPIYDSENCQLESFKDKLRHFALSTFQRFKKHQPKPVLSDDEKKALKSLSKDKSLVITRPDKGNGVVILDKNDYITKVSAVLQDTSKFQKVEDLQPLTIIFKQEDKINRTLRKYIGGVDSNGKKFATYVSGSKLGVLYGLPKVHKENYPIRPILSACNTPGYGLAKYLVPIISPVTTNSYTVKDSFSFAKEISNFSANGLFMASFDVKSLFTNIPLKETIDIIIYELFDNPENDSNILLNEKEEKVLECQLLDRDEFCYFTKECFREFLELATLDNHFFFNNEIYKQIDGVAMGSPLGPTLANAFMSHMEKKWLRDCPSHFKPVLYRRYVDDTFLLFENESNIDLFLQFLNSQHPNISFTCDKEVETILLFLDIKIKRDNDRFRTSIYRKPTFTGLLSKYYSFTPLQYKENLISTLICRAFRISSDYFSFDSEVQFLKNILQKNGYPLRFIETHIFRMLKKLYKPYDHVPVDNYDVPKPIIYFTTYFLGNISNVLAKDIKALLSDSYPQVHLRMLYKSYNTIGSSFSFKDKTPVDCMSNVVYKYTCECCKASYIGKTEVQFRCRICQHLGISPRTGDELKVPVASKIREHSLKCKTHINVDNFTILDSLPSKKGILILESLHQKIKKPSIGTHEQSTPLLCFD